jgi:hypothetical protein
MDNLESIFELDIPEEYRWERIRICRDQLLKNSDYRMIEDVPGDKVTWANYRQSLRDLPSSVDNPLEIVFPDSPSA